MPNNRGFTVIELLIVLAISALLSAIAIGYSSISRNYTALTVQESKIAQLILQAKSLSIATYANGATACGYGMKISASTTPQTFSIFAYSPTGVPPCPTEDELSTNGFDPDGEKQYTPATWKVALGQGVQIQSMSDSLGVVLFYPPNPDVFLSTGGTTFQAIPATLKIHLITIDGQNTATLSINPEGQVSL